MSYKQFVPLTNLNFQFNRVLSHGEESCREAELWEIAPYLTKFAPMEWFRQWNRIAVRAEMEGRLMHAAYYHRMSEFFLPEGVSEKSSAYENFRRCFYKAVALDNVICEDVPYGSGRLPVLSIKASEEKGVILLHGGYDSFMEEFYLEAKNIRRKGYTLIIFEGPGQGRTLREGLKMTHDWEKPVKAVMDHFDLSSAALVGISLGGYLALRAAAFEPRIKQVVAYDVVYDMLGCFTAHLPDPFQLQFKDMIHGGQKEQVNRIAEALRAGNDLVDWALTHGMYITGASDPFDYFHRLTEFNTIAISPLIAQDVLLLAGENDHLVPLEMYDKQKNALVNARSVRGRIYTAAEGGDQHCQVGNIELAWRDILSWLEECRSLTDRP